MRKRMITLCLTGLAFALGTMAQTKAVRVDSPIVTEKDFVWYVEQKEAWREATQRNSQDEEAWLNYYNAARYMAWYQEEDSTARQVVREMEAAIPDSYTFNYCAYRESTSGKGYGDAHAYAEAALAKLPAEMQFFDYDQWVCYLAMQGHEERMAQMAKRYFDSGIYSEAVLRYSYNELAGMEQDGIYLSSGDAAILHDALHEALQRLPEPYAMLFSLHYEEELTIPQIAQITSLPEGTVKSRLHKTMNIIKQNLKQYESR